jgi:phytoene synthase
MREAGLDPDAFVASPVMSVELKNVIARLLAVADGLYARARSGVAYLPLACRPAILAAGLIYAEIGRAVEALSHDSVSHRAHVPTSRKVQLLTKAVAATPWLTRGAVIEPLRAVAFLIEAVKQTPAPVAAKALAQPRPFVNVGPQFVRVLDIFERLERAEQMSKSR